MRDLLSNLIARLRTASRQERLAYALGTVLVLVLLRYGVAWLIDYRQGVKEDIQLSADRLANARRTVAHGPEVQKQLAALQERLRDTVALLVPGDTPTLAAAALQDRVSSLAAEKSVSLQTTQVMKDEAVGPFRKVSLRITATGELRHLAEFLSELEFGNLRVAVPFIELSRRGVARRDANPRSVSATIEVSGIVQGSAAPHRGPGAVPVADASGGGGGGTGGTGGTGGAAPLEGPALAPGALPGALPGGLAPRQEKTEVPSDPLGTSQLAEPSP